MRRIRIASKRHQQPCLSALLNAHGNYLYIFPKKNYKLSIYSISFAGFLISAKCHILSSFNIRFGETPVIELKDSEYRSNPIKHAIIGCFIWFASFIGLSSSAFASSQQHSGAAECQAKIQRIETVQSNPNQEMQRPAQGWVNLEKLPDRWEKRWPDFHGIAWYKIHFSYTCDTNMSNPPLSFAIEGITQSGKIFLNDDLLWQDLYLKEPASRSQYMPRIWNLPTSSLKQGQNTLWIQVYGSITQKSGLGHVALGNYPSTYSLYKTWLLEKRILPELNMMVNIVVGVFYLLAWLANRKEKAFF